MSFVVDHAALHPAPPAGPPRSPRGTDPERRGQRAARRGAV
ncbi:hypothetical protein QJS66_13960 [Kocuria rhizophila]|nr:hypothetical protein QJS66_13960 [Kocuria rhizophila]